MKKKGLTLVFLSMIAMLLAIPASAAQTSEEHLTAMEIAALINGYRAEKGLYQYVYNTTLESVAQKHTDYQVTIQLSTHEGEGGSTSKDRVTASGYGEGNFIFADEMIYSGGFATPAAALEWWKNSPIHNGIMLSEKYHEFGVGVRITEDRKYYTINFGAIQGVTSPGVGSAPLAPEVEPSTPVTVAPAGTDGSIVHLVVVGQTLQQIADAYQVSLQVLLANNSLAENASLSAGQQIVIKPAESAPPAEAPAAVTTSQPEMAVIPAAQSESAAAPGESSAVPQGYTLIPNSVLTALVVVAVIASAGVTFFAYLRLSDSGRRKR